MSVEFIFLFSLNNSGTTVMSRSLAQQTGGYLPPYGNNEGQMAPAVISMMRSGAWDPTRAFDWPAIRAEWSALAEAEGKALFIEASPPNALRAGAILAAFGPNTRAVFSAASPYAYIASVLYNYRAPPLTEAMVEEVTRRWVTRARLMRAAIEAHPDIPRISYESFCADPSVLNAATDVPLRPVDATMTGKTGSAVAGIQDLTRRQLAFLTAEEWEVANAILAKHARLIEFFGYDLSPGAALVAEAGRDPELFAAGRARRAGWGPRWRRYGLLGGLQRAAVRIKPLLGRLSGGVFFRHRD